MVENLNAALFCWVGSIIYAEGVGQCKHHIWVDIYKYIGSVSSLGVHILFHKVSFGMWCLVSLCVSIFSTIKLPRHPVVAQCLVRWHPVDMYITVCPQVPWKQGWTQVTLQPGATSQLGIQANLVNPTVHLSNVVYCGIWEIDHWGFFLWCQWR